MPEQKPEGESLSTVLKNVPRRDAAGASRSIFPVQTEKTFRGGVGGWRDESHPASNTPGLTSLAGPLGSAAGWGKSMINGCPFLAGNKERTGKDERICTWLAKTRAPVAGPRISGIAS